MGPFEYNSPLFRLPVKVRDDVPPGQIFLVHPDTKVCERTGEIVNPAKSAVILVDRPKPQS